MYSVSVDDRGQFYQVVVLKLFTYGVPHVAVMVDSVESNVIIVNLQQPIHWGWVVTDDVLWKQYSHCDSIRLKVSEK